MVAVVVVGGVKEAEFGKSKQLRQKMSAWRHEWIPKCENHSKFLFFFLLFCHLDKARAVSKKAAMDSSHANVCS